MNEKSIIVTGGNAGIGKAIAVELSKQGRHVIIVSRNAEKGGSALEKIKTRSNNNRVDLIIGDLSTVASTRDLADAIIKKAPGASVLINNAGIWPAKLEVNSDGLEIAFMVNHMAPFILSHMLLSLLKKNAPARIVNVNAGLYVFGKLDIDKTPYGRDFGRFATYMNTKLCNILFTLKFSRVIQNTGVTINAVHPGVIRTNLGDTGGLSGVLMKIAKGFFKTPERGAKPPVWLATSPEVEGVNGRYFELFTRKPYTENACDANLRDELWDLSMKIAGIRDKN